MSTTTHQGAERAESYQERVRQHFLYVAGDDTTDMPERRDRACEEFAELQQSLGGTLEGWIAVGRYVWGRPVGEPAQEMGGTLNTLAALAAWAGLDMMACGEAELERTKRPELVAKIRRKRANRHGRGPLPGDDADLITSTPAPRTDGGMTAGEDVPLEAVRGILKDTATPAQPAGAVPDGLRALLERARFNIDGMRDATHPVAKEIDAFLASHPAGQSAGSGAERWRCPECGCREYARVDQRQPGGNYAPGPLVRCVECKDVFNAPDSTRTGQGEAEAVEVVAEALWRSDTPSEGPTGWADWKAYVEGHGNPPTLAREIEACRRRARAAINALAALPAAPEAQGAWQDISTAPPNKAVQVYVPNHDYYGNEGVYAGMLVDMGTGQRWMTFAWAMGRDMCGDDRPTHWRPLPAPPASSGQGGR